MLKKKKLYHQIFEGMIRLLSPLVWAGFVPEWVSVLVQKYLLTSTQVLSTHPPVPNLLPTSLPNLLLPILLLPNLLLTPPPPPLQVRNKELLTDDVC
jgi:hypothetical protein